MAPTTGIIVACCGGKYRFPCSPTTGIPVPPHLHGISLEGKDIRLNDSAREDWSSHDEDFVDFPRIFWTRWVLESYTSHIKC
ncbi:hypothetical protein CVT26_004480, partial [Gymnopilus dilepis]